MIRLFCLQKTFLVNWLTNCSAYKCFLYSIIYVKDELLLQLVTIKLLIG